MALTKPQFAREHSDRSSKYFSADFWRGDYIQ